MHGVSQHTRHEVTLTLNHVHYALLVTLVLIKCPMDKWSSQAIPPLSGNGCNVGVHNTDAKEIQAWTTSSIRQKRRSQMPHSRVPWSYKRGSFGPQKRSVAAKMCRNTYWSRVSFRIHTSVALSRLHSFVDPHCYQRDETIPTPPILHPTAINVCGVGGSR